MIGFGVLGVAYLGFYVALGLDFSPADSSA